MRCGYELGEVGGVINLVGSNFNVVRYGRSLLA